MRQTCCALNMQDVNGGCKTVFLESDIPDLGSDLGGIIVWVSIVMLAAIVVVSAIFIYLSKKRRRVENGLRAHDHLR